MQADPRSTINCRFNAGWILAALAALSTGACRPTTDLARSQPDPKTRCEPMATDSQLVGRWARPGGSTVFEFSGSDNAGYTARAVHVETGLVYKIRDVSLRGDQVSFKIVHDSMTDDAVRQNGGKPYENWALGIVGKDDMHIRGSRGGTGESAFDMHLSRLPSQDGESYPSGGVRAPAMRTPGRC